MDSQDTPDKAKEPARRKAPQAPQEQKREKAKRIFKGMQEVIHDLYKLLPSEMVKNHSYWSSKPTFIGHEHTHIFHSVDSNGKKQSHSSMTGGHCHKVSYQVDEEGIAIPESIKIGPPVRKAGSVYHPIPIQFDGEGRAIKWDDHTHDMHYILSEKIKVRTKNNDAAKAMAEYMAQRDRRLKIRDAEPAKIDGETLA